jgi:hypothetical protein
MLGMQHPGQASTFAMTRASLHGAGAPPVVSVYSLFLGGALLEVLAPLAPGAGFVLELAHPAFGQATVNAVVAWCQQLPDRRQPIAALEFHGSWDGLTAIRHQLAGWLGSRVFDGPAFAGYVLQEPQDSASSCWDAATAKVALVIPHEQGFAVRKRGADPRADVPLARSFPEALRLAFDLERLPSLNVPDAARPAPPAVAPATQDPEEELLGMNTVVIKPEALKNAKVPGADTSVVSPTEDSRVLGGGRFFGPSADRYPHSRVLRGDQTVAYVAQSGAEGSFNLFDPQGRKLALLARPNPSAPVQILFMGDNASDSLQFLDADDFHGALGVTLEIDEPLAVEPPLEGFI